MSTPIPDGLVTCPLRPVEPLDRPRTGFRRPCFWTSWDTGGAEWRSREENPLVICRLGALVLQALLRALRVPPGPCGCNEVVVL
ncbi:hypothetical protein NDU88_002444 [Pleurodeles waltl]|uniref:Uncharacterized protein n=1 Tax=Pleurodeles waltl TaxID=8319 RepID=A0AAV7NH64_PLEWA|nr:hypothetical protein NDU88_002444 [Pleurodeles waltl]